MFIFFSNAASRMYQAHYSAVEIKTTPKTICGRVFRVARSLPRMKEEYAYYHWVSFSCLSVYGAFEDGLKHIQSKTVRVNASKEFLFSLNDLVFGAFEDGLKHIQSKTVRVNASKDFLFSLNDLVFGDVFLLI